MFNIGFMGENVIKPSGNSVFDSKQKENGELVKYRSLRHFGRY